MFDPRFDQQTDLVVALQQQGAELGRERHLSFAHAVQQRFDVMGESDHPVQPKYACRPFDSVGTAEQCIQHIAVTGVVFQLEEQQLDALNLLLGFADESRQCLGNEAAVHFFRAAAHVRSPWRALRDKSTEAPRASQVWARVALGASKDQI